MADWPSYTKNAQVATQAVTITPPSDTTGATAQDRLLKQQWKDAAASGVAKDHPLSINRDSSYVTDDPYSS